MRDLVPNQYSYPMCIPLLRGEAVKKVMHVSKDMTRFGIIEPHTLVDQQRISDPHSGTEFPFLHTPKSKIQMALVSSRSGLT